MYICKTEYRGV